MIMYILTIRTAITSSSSNNIKNNEKNDGYETEVNEIVKSIIFQ